MTVYYSLVLLVLIAAGPWLLWSAKRRAGLAQKFGLVPRELAERLISKRPRVWFHAVSVGEFNAVWPLISAWAEKHRDFDICISTTTQSAQRLAQERAQDKALVFYFPFDLPWAIAAWLNAVKPDLVAIVETEIWPGFTFECARRGIALVAVNGRISPRSFRFYHRLRLFFGPVLRRFVLIATQSEADAKRYTAIAGTTLPVKAVGNLKWDGLTPVSAEEQQELRRRLGATPEDRIIIAGSTHEGEEMACLKAFRQLIASDAEIRSAGIPGKANGGQLRLILAPRHPERFDRVASLIESGGFGVRRFSHGERLEKETDVYLLDTIGQLFRFYSLATVAFVGGTLAPIGGHNLLEPYAYAVPVVCGMSLDKTRDVADALIEHEALTIIGNGDALAAALASLLADDNRRRQLGLNGRRWLYQSQGAVKRTLDLLESALSGSPSGFKQQAAAALNVRGKT